MSDNGSLSEQLAKFEQIMDAFFRCDPEEEKKKVEDAFETLRTWAKKEVAELDRSRESLEKERESINQFKDEIDAVNRELDGISPDSSDSASIQKYNKRVLEQNEMVAKQRERISDYEPRQKEYGDRVDRFKEEQESRKKDAEAVQDEYVKKVNEMNDWFKRKGDREFFKSLNAFYAALKRGEFDDGKEADKVEGALAAVRGIRREVGEWMEKQEEAKEEGMLITRVELFKTEDSPELCRMIIDIASSLVTVSPELVKALDLDEYVGEEIELTLPNNITVMAPQLLLPGVTVVDPKTTAEFVRGVVLDTSSLGVDGCLGLSFLNRFDYSIRRRERPPLALGPKEAPVVRVFDVFISHKSEDFELAKTVYDFLRKSGYKPFLTPNSIPDAGTTDIHRAIDRGLEDAVHLVVVFSAEAYALAPYVAYEWRRFETGQRSGLKWGNIIPVVSGDVNVRSLPDGLGGLHGISLEHSDWQGELLHFLPRRP